MAKIKLEATWVVAGDTQAAVTRLVQLMHSTMPPSDFQLTVEKDEPTVPSVQVLVKRELGRRPIDAVRDLDGVPRKVIDFMLKDPSAEYDLRMLTTYIDFGEKVSVLDAALRTLERRGFIVYTSHTKFKLGPCGKSL